MPYNRFCEIHKFLHFVNNETFDPKTHPNPKLYKVWPVLEHLNELFQRAVTPERDIIIDETLMLYKGRLGWQQYMPKKQSCFGVKSYLLCESSSRIGRHAPKISDGPLWDCEVKQKINASTAGGTKKKKNENIAFCQGKVITMKWKDKKDVTMLSTVHTNDMVDEQYHNKVIRKFTIVTDYSKNMGAVDIEYQYIGDYCSKKR
ncbi:piggyBac transposable element-derived protein 4 [Trichonephila inaurata madagascariensis]|uniref:PiggyBac transposable element-derived protein 4 n=1 Tax=Trichonephila inaurata madagascariensis TaxID=2747483 RepID=A0A8X6XFU6_9ARAC|nr:piggyBac transposable element-derived protein 4 [Trichonephila inaurata madagascariensis]